jgi:hypothetical protein
MRAARAVFHPSFRSRFVRKLLASVTTKRVHRRGKSTLAGIPNAIDRPTKLHPCFATLPLPQAVVQLRERDSQTSDPTFAHGCGRNDARRLPACNHRRNSSISAAALPSRARDAAGGCDRTNKLSPSNASRSCNRSTSAGWGDGGPVAPSRSVRAPGRQTGE